MGTAKYALAFMCDSTLRLWNASSMFAVYRDGFDYSHPQQPDEAGSDVKSSLSLSEPVTLAPSWEVCFDPSVYQIEEACSLGSGMGLACTSADWEIVSR